MRLFIGIPLPADLINQLSALSVRLQSKNDGLRWSNPESWHITLQFLGSTEPERYNCITTQLRNLRHAPIPIELDDLGFFDRSGVFFAAVSPTPGLLSLQQRVTAATAPCGFIPETRPGISPVGVGRSLSPEVAFSLRKSHPVRRQNSTKTGEMPYHPHITLARSKGKAGAQSLRALKARLHHPPGFHRFTAAEFLLYESLPTPSGSRYEVRDRFPLTPDH